LAVSLTVSQRRNFLALGEGTIERQIVHCQLKQPTELIGGGVEVGSEEGTGLAFTVTLPYEVPLEGSDSLQRLLGQWPSSLIN
jgi:hypothetical protein